MEAQLIQRAKQGDETAFDSLIENHRQVMFRYAYLVVNDTHVAEDVTQEAVMRIYKYLDRFDETYPFRPWAMQITRNLARNHNRAWGRYKHMLTRLINLHNRQTTTIEALTHAQQQAHLLHDVVRQLKPDFQDVIYTRYFMDLSVEDCASMLDIPEGTVKSRAHRALKQLKAIIERDYPQLQPEASYE